MIGTPLLRSLSARYCGAKRQHVIEDSKRQMAGVDGKKVPKTLCLPVTRRLKRSEGATRQKAFSIGLSLDSRA